jgi:hypothetical protein
MERFLKLSLAFVCLFLASTLALANDPAKEFSIARNPNGLWSYGYTPTLGGSFTLYPVATANAEEAPGGDVWNEGGITCDNSCVSRSQRQEVLSSTGVDVVFPFDTLHLHPGFLGQYAVVRWTIPLSGTYELRGSFQGTQRYGPTTDVHLQWNSTVALFAGDINGFGDVALFDVRATVAAGDRIDFAVGIGGDGNFDGDSTAVQAIVDLVPDINIKPADPTNTISLSKPGDIPVAILSTLNVDAPTLVDRSSLTFGRIGDEQTLVFLPDAQDPRLRVPVCKVADVNGDGLKDLICTFERKPAGFQLTDAYGVLRGRTLSGITIKGTDTVHIVN